MKALKTIIVLSLSLFLITLTQCSKPKSITKVNLATAKNMWCSLSIIALEKGFFKSEGLDVNAQYLQGGRYCLDALLSNSVEFANIVEVNVSYIGFTGNENLSVIGTIVTSTSSAIIGRKSSGISSPQDVKGKKLALSPGMTSDIFAYRFLQRYDIDLDAVDIRNLQPLAMQGAIVSKGVDAVSTWEPFVHNIANALGDDAIQFREPEIYIGYENIAVRKDWALQNKDIVAAFLRANKKAENFIKENTQEAQEIIAEAINLDIDVVKATWYTYNMSLVFNSDKILNDVISEGEWIIKTQENYEDKPLPDYGTYFDTSYYQSLEE